MSDTDNKAYQGIVFGKATKETEVREVADAKRKAAALSRAWETRNFEIELYWKRALYFWGFIALAIVGYVKGHDTEYSLLIAGIGLVFSVAWFLVNKGSKFWQENWEAHIDCLEDEFEGKLYKTVMKKKIGFWNPLASYPFSVSRVNQAISFFIVLIWVGLIAKELSTLEFPDLLTKPYASYFILAGLVVVVGLILYFCKTGFMRKPVLKSIKTFLGKKTSPFDEIKGCKYEYLERPIDK